MVKYTYQFKHEVLQQYTAGNRSHSFEALARRYKIRGGNHLSGSGTKDGMEPLNLYREQKGPEGGHYLHLSK